MTNSYITNFSNYIAERTRDFTGREWIFAEIDKWLTTSGSPRYFIITGEPGIGKTAIAARLTQIFDLAAIHFCIAKQADTIDPLNFARSISHQLSNIYGFAKGILEDRNIYIDVNVNVQENIGSITGIQIENLIGESKSATTAFNRTVVMPLKKLYETGFDSQLLILVDALDEAVQQIGPENIVDLIANAQGLPSKVRFVLTSRPEGIALRQFEQLHIPYFELDAGRAENVQDIEDYLHKQLEKSSALQMRLVEQKILPQEFIEKVSIASEGNFLYLIWLLPAIENGTQKFDVHEALPKGLDGIYRDFLSTRTVGKDLYKWRTCYRPVLRMLALTKVPLREEQLAKFTGIGEQDMADYLFDLKQFLDPVLYGQKQYRLYHQSIMDFLCEKERAGEFWLDPVSVHQHIVAFYRGKALTWDEVDWNQIDDYGFQHLSAHLYELRDIGGYRQEFYRLICQSFMRAKYRRYGSHESFIKDIALSIGAAHAEKPPNLVQEVHGILIYATIESHEINVPSSVFEVLIRLGQDARAQNFVSLIKNKDLQTQAYRMIGEALIERKEKEKSKSAFTQALMATDKVLDTSIKIKELGEIAKAMAQLEDKTKAIEIVDRMLKEATIIEDEYFKAKIQVEIVKAMAQIGEKVRAMEKANKALDDAKKIEDDHSKTKAMGEIAKIMAQLGEKTKAVEIVDQARGMIEKIEDDYSKTKTMGEIAKIMAQLGEKTKAIEIVDQALKVAEKIQTEDSKAESMQWFSGTDWFVAGG